MREKNKKKFFSAHFRTFQGYTAQKNGRWGEKIALCLLRLKGYRILAQRFRFSFAEVDLIAARGYTLIFCEVKHRLSLNLAGEAISQKQKDRLSRAAQVFLQQYPEFQNYDIRFDAILVAPRKMPQHIQGAWCANAF